MKPQNNELSGLRTWLEIDREKVHHNYQVFRDLIKRETKLMAVVKSNAYGHDLFQFAGLQEKLGADWLGVDSITEGEALREAGIKIPILVLGYTLPEKFATALKNNISLTISTFENLSKLKSEPVNFHLKVDTGMHRQGFLPEQIPAVLDWLKKEKILAKNFEGIYTHFAAAKNPSFPAETKKQLALFEQVLTLVKQSGYSPIRHAAATSGTIVFPDTHLDLVRIGIGLYGFYPSAEVAAGFAEKLNLKPVLSWKTIISEIKDLPASSRLGYDFTETLVAPGRVAICPIGYWHGYARALSSIGHVLVRGQKARVLGRISMDMIIIDLKNIPDATIRDTVIVIGEDGGEEITATTLATLGGTINYEIVTRLNPLMRRVYL